MNRTKIEWADETLNPFYPKDFGQPCRWKKHRRIFWQSMVDLFSFCNSKEVINATLIRIKTTPQHTHIFCTKNPSRYADFHPWPENFWVGTTVTKQEDADKRLPELLKADASVRFVSVEPMLEAISIRACLMGKPSPDECIATNCPGYFHKIDWLIIGALTGPGFITHQPDPIWVQNLIDQCRAADVPVFLKDNLKWPVKIQEFPKLTLSLH